MTWKEFFMKSVILTGLLMFFSWNASAQVLKAPDSELVKKALESQTNCQNFVRFDNDNLYLGFGIYRQAFEEPRQPIPATLKIVPLQNPAQAFTINTADAALDVVTDNGTLWLLTYSGLEEWDRASWQRRAIYPTYALSRPMAYQEHAQAFARYQNKLIIAHGRLGVSLFDLQSKREINQIRLAQEQAPLESMATGVTVQGKYAFVVMDNFSLVPYGKPPFRGLIVIDMEQEKVVANMDGMDPGADAVLNDGQNLIVSFGGMPIWKYSLSRLTAGVLPSADRHIWQFPIAGHPTGLPSLDAKYYYTCFLKAPVNGSNGGYYTRGPVVLDRSGSGL
jgi:hypothetical protein